MEPPFDGPEREGVGDIWLLPTQQEMVGPTITVEEIRHYGAVNRNRIYVTHYATLV
jgi:hypothetical protein